MSIYDNKRTSKVYPHLNPTRPQEPQTYRLKKLAEIEAYLLDEIEVCEWIAKKMKQFNTVSGILDTDLITSAVITGENSIAVFASSVVLPVSITLSGTRLFLSLATVITQNSFKIFTTKQKNTMSLSCWLRVS